MKRKPTDTGRNVKVMDQLAKLIDVRLPTGHGYALLTFPLGDSVDARMRYVGKGSKVDIVEAMQAFVDQQRNPSGNGWGHSAERSPTQFTAAPPVAPGYYVLKVDHPSFKDPELVKLVEDEKGLRLHYWDGDGFDSSMEWANELDPACHIWLGPLPQPWTNETPAAPLEVIEPTKEELARHHLPRFNAVLEEYLEDFNARTTTPGEPIPEAVQAMIRDAIGFAFARGVVAQMDNPIPHTA